jgi:ribosomal protein S12 methylthiotransferase
MKIGFISLGCPKNQVNCEQMLWQVYEAGHEIALEAEDCDIAVVNTCGFLQEATREALDEISRLAKLKKEGRLGKIIVVGCMAERYQNELLTLCPEGDGFVGCGSYTKIAQIVAEVERGERPFLFEDNSAPIPETDRVVATSDHWAFLRIAEGCDNHCSYCMIPSIRGRFRSRPREAILKEAVSLAECGIKEIIVVAQDITRYGLDLYGRRQLTELLRDLCQVEGIEWIRLHYLYPDEIDDALISVIAKEDKILKYIDLPIQHISTPILKAMNRRGTGEELRGLLKKLRERIPGLVIRTSLICGFPGETEADFEELCSFLREYRLERAGIFAYSPEEGSQAAKLEGQVDEEVKRRRLELLTEIQLDVVDAYCEAQIGKTVTVLCEGVDALSGCFFGRSFAESPEIDGRLYIETEEALISGQFYPVKIVAVEDGELFGIREGASS